MKRKNYNSVFVACLKVLKLVLIKLNVCTFKVLSDHSLENFCDNVRATVPFGKEDWQLSFLYSVFKFENVTLLL